MRIIHSILALTMIMAVSMCSKSDDFGDNGGIKGKKTLIIDGEPYYCGSYCSVEQTSGRGMYLYVKAVEDTFFEVSGKELIVNIPPSRVSELKVGDVFQAKDLSVRNFGSLSGIEVNAYSWNALSGSIKISGMSSTHLNIQIQKLVIEHRISEVQHTIEGTASLHIQ